MTEPRLYDHFGYLEQVKNPGFMLDKKIYWTVKEDGSNTAIWYDEENHRYRVASRNQKVAQFEPNVLQLPEVHQVIQFMDWVRKEYGSDYTVYGEFMQTGWSPTHLKLYDHPSYKVFDIYDHKKGNYLDYDTMYNLLRPWNIPVVELIAVTKSKSVEHLIKTQSDLMKALDVREKTIRGNIVRFFRRISNRLEEGLVAKCVYTYEGTPCHVYFKAKYLSDKKIKKITDKADRVKLPQIDHSELLKCVHKVKDMLSEEDFKKQDVAMPLIAKEVALELKQTGTRNSEKLYPIYLEVLENDDDFHFFS